MSIGGFMSARISRRARRERLSREAQMRNELQAPVEGTPLPVAVAEVVPEPPVASANVMTTLESLKEYHKRNPNIQTGYLDASRKKLIIIKGEKCIEKSV
jgi:hypothetical protein